MSNVRRVRDDDYGVYVWQNADGTYLKDDEGNYLSVESKFGDIRRIRALTDAATYYGSPNGKAVFDPGKRKISDAQYEWQKERLADGKDFEL